MQEGVREQDMLNRLEQTLSGMDGLEKLVLGIDEFVSFEVALHCSDELPVP